MNLSDTKMYTLQTNKDFPKHEFLQRYQKENVKAFNGKPTARIVELRHLSQVKLSEILRSSGAVNNNKGQQKSFRKNKIYRYDHVIQNT